jgi:molybdopterin-containing oxidoreductase family iron-sulfur binding subunit
MKAGTVQTLVVLGGNPVFDAPADLDFAAAIAKVPHSIVLGHSVDETSSKAEWHIPRAHYLEAWGDARALGGTVSVVQPLILPLFGGKTSVELLGVMIVDKDRPGYDIVRDTWKPTLGEAEFDKKWNRVLHDGLLAGSELAELLGVKVGRGRGPRERRGIRRWFGNRVRPVTVASRRPLRERRVAAGTS